MSDIRKNLQTFFETHQHITLEPPMTPPETLTESEIDRLLYWLKTNPSYDRSPRKRARDYLIGCLLADAGLRVSEVVSLSPTQLLTPALPTPTHPTHAPLPLNMLFLPGNTTKTGHSRSIPLTHRLRQAITNYFDLTPTHWQLPDHKYAFPGRSNLGHTTTRQVHRIIDRAARNSIHRPVHPHILRHTFATRIVRGSNTRVAQQLLGHKSLSSTQVYVHPNADDLATAIASLNKPISP